MRKVWLIAFIVYFLARGGAVYIYNHPIDKEGFLFIPYGSSGEKVSLLLYEKGFILHPVFFKFLLRAGGREKGIKAGEYFISRGSSLIDIYEKLMRGKVYLRQVTIPEGKDIFEIARIFEEKGFFPASEFLSACRDTKPIADLAPGAKTVEGYLFPDTYQLSHGTPPREIIRLMVENLKRVLTPELKKRAKELGLSIHQLITLASLIEKETSTPDERPLISAVFHRRLKRGMLLQCDPTLIYALKLAGRYDGNIRRRDLRFESPYNTYIHPGLPPGPVANPGKDSIIAALYPADVPYLYFVSMNNGRHYFSRTLAEHNRAVYKYQKLYWRLKWRKERAKKVVKPGFPHR
ncbi:MAG: endolytic transglycosylase MltG [Acidobacteria bacterium]|nr:endolytic transglycosylase MltG [Acidobacteriota bacterium]